MNKDKYSIAKLKAYLDREDTKKTIKIVVICVCALLLVGIGAYIAYRYFFASEDDYDLYDELDIYYDEDEEEEADEEEAAAEEAAEEA